MLLNQKMASGLSIGIVYYFLNIELYQPATYRQKDDGNFQIVDEEDSTKVSSYHL